MSGRNRKRRSDTRDPRRSRARALKLLYQADVRGEDPIALLDKVASDGRAASLLDDLDPDQAADIEVKGAADDAEADPEHARIAAARGRNAAPIDGFTRSLVTGVSERRDELDALVQRFARRWALARMPAVDRNALRLGAYELQHETTSPAVVINEMVELAKGLSTDDSGRYVNGVLEAIRKELAATPSPEPITERPEPVTEPPEPVTEPLADPEPVTEPVADLEPVTEPVADLEPAPVALPDDVELVEASAPVEEHEELDLDEPAAAAAPEPVDLAPDDVDELALADVPSPAEAALDEDPGREAADEPETDPADELRHEHGHVADRDASEEDAAQQQLF